MFGVLAPQCPTNLAFAPMILKKSRIFVAHQSILWYNSEDGILQRGDFLLDYSITDPGERVRLVRDVIDDADPGALTNRYLSRMADYILFASDRNQTRAERDKSHPIVTRNRSVTISKRQTSLEDVIGGLENGEDGLYSIMNRDRDLILDNRDVITQDDVERIPGMADMMDVIGRLKSQLSRSTGRTRYAIKKQLIETWQQAYLLKASHDGSTAHARVMGQVREMAHVTLDEHVTFDECGEPVSDCLISLFDPTHISFLLSYYSALKQESWEELHGDMHWLLIDLECCVDSALRDRPEMYDILVWKVDGLSNDEIGEMVRRKYGSDHSNQYISTIWRQQIPRLVADEAKRLYIWWWYKTSGRGIWKSCSRCGRSMPAHPMYFSRNGGGALYSVCKDCRKVIDISRRGDSTNGTD